MLTKIVRFKDGKYAVRRWVPFNYQYLDNNLGGIFGDTWWTFRYVQHAKVGSYDQAKKLLEDYKLRKLNSKDCGTPVNNEGN